MFGKRVKSALFIDFENVPDLCPPDRIANWVWWLEQGTFDPKGSKRRLAAKNVYYGPKDRKHKDAFQDHGFNVIECDKFHVLKNGADIRIALDVMETIVLQPEIDEFIIFAKDTDYTPVLQRLKLNKFKRAKKSVILADENQERVFSLFLERANLVIPVRLFREAANSMPPVGVLARASERLKELFAVFRRTHAHDENEDVVEQPREEVAQASEPSPPSLAKSQYRPSKGVMAAAVRCVIRATSPRPNAATPRREIEKELKENVAVFKTAGPKSYLGYGSFPELMKAIQSETDRIRVYERGGGIHVQYVPKDDD